MAEETPDDGMEWTTIPVRRATRDKLKDISHGKESYDKLLNRLMMADPQALRKGARASA